MEKCLYINGVMGKNPCNNTINTALSVLGLGGSSAWTMMGFTVGTKGMWTKDGWKVTPSVDTQGKFVVITLLMTFFFRNWCDKGSLVGKEGVLVSLCGCQH